MKSRVLLGVTLLLVGLSVPAPSIATQRAPTTWAYPGAAPCDGTLQQCVTGVNAGDIIHVVEDVPAPGAFTSITKSVTIEGSPGLSQPPVLGKMGSSSTISVSSEDETDTTQVDVTIRNLRTRELLISAYYPKGSGSTFEVSDLRMKSDFGSNNATSIGLTAYAPIEVIVSDNVIEADGNPISITAVPGGTAGFGNATPGTFEAWIERNVATTPSDLSHGVQVSLRPLEGSTAHVRLYDNLLIGLGNCNCGSASGMAVRSSPPSAPFGTAIADIWHNTVVRSGRGSDGSAPGMWLAQDSGTSLRVNLFNNIMANGKGPAIIVSDDSGSPKIVSGFNDSYGNTEPDEWSGVPHPNHLKVDPRFVEPGSGNYRLRADSPLIDAGTVCRPGGLGVLDVGGLGRLAGKMVDIGAYERGATQQTEGVAEMGTSGDDLLLGTSGQDFLCGFGGVDEIRGMGGNDYLDGGKAPDDMVYGGKGADVLVTKDGWDGDLADGGGGSDFCRTDAGDIRISC